jgi:hypothetical protein
VNATFTVWRWAWLPPLVENPRPAWPLPANTITTVTNVSNRIDDPYWRERDEVALDDAAPIKARQNAQRGAKDALAKLSASTLGEGRFKGACVLICGDRKGGCGKSLTARALALGLSAKLVAYNATRIGGLSFAESVDAFSDTIGTFHRPLVFLWDEFDVDLKRIVEGSTEKHANFKMDAQGKGGFNGLFDTVHRETDVVLVCSCNSSRAQLMEIVRGDATLLREGRFDEVQEYDDDGDRVRKSAGGVPYKPADKRTLFAQIVLAVQSLWPAGSPVQRKPPVEPPIIPGCGPFASPDWREVERARWEARQ